MQKLTKFSFWFQFFFTILSKFTCQVQVNALIRERLNIYTKKTRQILSLKNVFLQYAIM